MENAQPDLFAQDTAERNRLSDTEAVAIRLGLEETLTRLAAAETFFWPDPLDAVHEENRFERRAKLLGDEGAAL